ncbi:OmpA family protein [Amaricoccus sp.]|uniref:OmpA family protein n=1 Tax=Amaricoccus sp. TaxID=1872485 RepID=UPI001B62D416|nr:OmpA family protein [Amaricoccus sp.]MBP7241719.1 OmpA family protein [Amaricoccus sp.]
MAQFRIAALVVSVLAVPLPVTAQDWTDQELRQRFESQMDTFRELGASRGLVLTNRPAPAAGATVAGTDTAGGATLAPADGSSLTLASTQHVSLPEDEQVFVRVTFGFDSAVLADDQKPALRQLCKAMDEVGVNVFRIIGHTDATGGARYNQQLSVLRAEAVERFFVDDCGVVPERLQAVGVGKDYPLNAKDPFAAENRRVEFQAMS